MYAPTYIIIFKKITNSIYITKFKFKTYLGHPESKK